MSSWMFFKIVGTSPLPTGAQEQPKKGETLVYALGGDPAHLNIAITSAREASDTVPTPAADCDAHHRRSWTKHHGKTDEENLDLFCTFHHHLVHEGGWTYQIIDHETLHFYPPNGRPVRISKRRGPGHLRT